MDSTTNGYFPLPTLGDSGASKLAEYNAIIEAADGVLKALYDGTFTGDLVLPSDTNVYLGGATTAGSWRIRRSGNDLQFQRYESSTWVTKGAVNP